MRLLLDTHVVLWQLAGFRTLSPAAWETIEQASHVLFSVVSFAEIGVKAAIGKLSVPPDLRAFDRLLVAQARCDDLTIVTADKRFAAYDVRLVAAGG